MMVDDIAIVKPSNDISFIDVANNLFNYKTTSPPSPFHSMPLQQAKIL
jgi:hypothetical protein